MLYRFFNKCLVFGTILLFVSVGLGFPCDTPSQGNIVINLNTYEEFASIQGAIDDTDTLNGHLLIVFNSMCIHERITVNKSVRIMGEPVNKPIIDGRCGGNIITITADGVIIENLIIENYEDDDLPFSCGALYAGIKVESNDNIIRNNEFRRCPKAVYLYSSTSGNQIYDNEITCNLDNYFAVMLVSSTENEIHHNTITVEDGVLGEAFSLTSSDNNRISFNVIDGHYYGIFLYLSDSNYMMYNSIKNCDCGIYFLCPNDYNNYTPNDFDNNDDDYIFDASYGTCTGNQ